LNEKGEEREGGRERRKGRAHASLGKIVVSPLSLLSFLSLSAWWYDSILIQKEPWVRKRVNLE